MKKVLLFVGMLILLSVSVFAALPNRICYPLSGGTLCINASTFIPVTNNITNNITVYNTTIYNVTNNITSNDGNNYTMNISFSGTTNRTLNLSRFGMTDLIAWFQIIWTDILNTPTYLSNFTDNLGNRGYNDLGNFTNSPAYINVTSNLSVNYSSYSNYSEYTNINNLQDLNKTSLSNFTNDLNFINYTANLSVNYSQFVNLSNVADTCQVGNYSSYNGTRFMCVPSNATGTGNGNISGSGTAGYIPQWQNATTLNNSGIFQNGTNIGIGTTSPSTIFHIKGSGIVRPTVETIGASSYAGFDFTTPSGLAGQFVVAGSSFSNGLIRNNDMVLIHELATGGLKVGSLGAGGYFQVFTGGLVLGTNERMTITSAGNVGIGTTTPTLAKLQVAGATLTQKLVEPNTAGVGSPNIITLDESGTIYTNEGATALNYHTLPTAAAGLTFTFYVDDADGIIITAGASDLIQINGVASSAAGTATSTTIGSSITLTAINAVDWVATSVVGTWALA